MAVLTIVPLEEKYLQRVVQIHQDGLGYTFNSRLGPAHLSFMYSFLVRQPEAYVGIALYEDQPVGVVSGTLDVEKTKQKLMKALRPKQILSIFLNLLLQPTLWYEWIKGNIINREIVFDGVLVRPVLTAIVVHPGFQGKSIGKMLIKNLERFFEQNKMQYYRLDTLQENVTANAFYRNLGFHKVQERADSVIYIKKIDHE